MSSAESSRLVTTAGKALWGCAHPVQGCQRAARGPLCSNSEHLSSFSTMKVQRDDRKCSEGTAPLGMAGHGVPGSASPASPPVLVRKGFSSLEISSWCLECVCGSMCLICNFNLIARSRCWSRCCHPGASSPLPQVSRPFVDLGSALQAPPAPHPRYLWGRDDSQHLLWLSLLCHCFACSYWNSFIWQPLKPDIDDDEQGKAETCCFQEWILTAKAWCLLQSTLGKLLVS